MTTNAIVFDPCLDVPSGGRVLFDRALACLARFTERRGDDECWLWSGSVSANGYAFVRAYHLGVTFRMHAHRFALIASGVALRSTDDACHRCDVRRCVNPRHLFAGTRSDNMRDMMQKGRRVYPVGSVHAAAKLSDVDVREIRRRVAAGETQRSVARVFGVNGGYVSRIVHHQMRAEVV